MSQVGAAEQEPSYDAAMRIAGIVFGLFIAAVGAVWMLQGLGSQAVPQSFMTANGAWIAIGAVTLAGGLVMAWWNWSRR